MNTSDFHFVRNFLKEHSAIVLDDGKEYLVESRLLPLARDEGLEGVPGLIDRIRRERFNGLHRRVVEAMTTNETSFFRDRHVFLTIEKEVLPPIIAAREARRSLRIWCGACSTGQEPYSLAMLLEQHFPQLAQWRVEIQCTDLDSEVLARAKEGSYSKLEVNRGLPAALLVRFFEKQGGRWQVRERLRKLLTFRQMNLAASWPHMPKVDLILLRNVLIYFDVPTKRLILERMARHLEPDGLIFLGAAESTLNITDAFERVVLDGAVAYRPARR